MGNNDKVTTITLDLNNTSSPSALPPDSFLHRRQYETFFRSIASTLDRIEPFKKSLNTSQIGQVGYFRVHDVITVHGTRGSGKTTFLLSALNILQDEKNYTEYCRKMGIRNLELSPQDFCILKIVDPTLFAYKEHLLHIVLSQISKEIQNYKSHRPAFTCVEGGPCYVEKWYEDLAKLSKGLQVVGESRDDAFSAVSTAESSWKDAEFALQHDLDNVQHSMDLEQGFHKIVRDALDILGKKAFILALDDTDTRPRIGWHILEVLRRYFTTPQLIVIVSGDIDLFSTIIRQRHTVELGLSVKKPYDQESPYKKHIDNLTEQYLLKILRSQQRINIGNFSSAIENNLDAVFTIKNSEQEKPVKELLDIFFSYIGCSTKYEQDVFKQALLSNPCRTVVQVLDTLYDTIKKRDFNPSLRLSEIFFTQVQIFGLNTFDFQEQIHSPHGISALMEIISHKHSNKIGYDLLPKYFDSNFNAAMLVLQAGFAKAMRQNPSLLLSYMFKACLLKEVQQTPELQQATYAQVHEHLALDEDTPLHKLVKNIATLSWQQLRGNDPLSKHGVLRLYGESISKNAPAAVKAMYNNEVTNVTLENTPNELQTFRKNIVTSSPPLGSLVNTPQSLYDNIQSWHKDIVHLGFLRIKIANGEFQLFSIFALLATMGEILSCKNANEIKHALHSSSTVNVFKPFSSENTTNALFELEEDFDENTPSEETLTDDIEIRKNTQGEIPTNPTNEDRNENEEHDESEDSVENFENRLLRWKKNYFYHAPLLPTLSSRIMTRYYETLQGISESINPKDLFLGSYVHRCLVAFFNSVLVEEALISDKFSSCRNLLKLDNIRNSDKLFYENVESIHNHFLNEERHGNKWDGSLFYLIFTCPLWELYLDKTINDDKSVYNLYNKIKLSDLEFIKDSGFGKIKKYETEHHKFSCTVEYSFNSSFDGFYALLNSIAIPKRSTSSTKNSKSLSKITEEGRRAGLSEKPVRFANANIYIYLSRKDDNDLKLLKKYEKEEYFYKIVDRFYAAPELKTKFKTVETFRRFINYIKSKE